MDRLVELRIEELLTEHQEIYLKKVRKYMVKYQKKESVLPIGVSFCVHSGKYHLEDGHHRAFAKYLLGKSSILALVEPCYIYNCENRFEFKRYNIRHAIIE